MAGASRGIEAGVAPVQSRIARVAHVELDPCAGGESDVHATAEASPGARTGGVVPSVATTPLHGSTHLFDRPAEASHGRILAQRIGAGALALLISCATHRQSAVQLDESAQQDTQSHAAESLEIHRIEEPSRVTTTTEEYGSPQEAAPQASASGVPDVQAVEGRAEPEGRQGNGEAIAAAEVPTGSDVPLVVPFHGPLLRRVVRVEERGQVSETTSAKGSSEATAAATATIAAKADSERDSKPSLGLPVLGLVLAGIAASAILTRGIWLGPAFNLVKQLFGKGA
jgi:hypothetical protein